MWVAPFVMHYLNSPFADGIWQDAFRTRQGWIDYLDDMDRGSPSFPQQGARAFKQRSFWTASQMQHLFILMWAHAPAVKGSYMLELESKALAEAATVALTQDAMIETRVSSHMPQKRFAQGFSAHKGWAFLEGYSELLVQIEEFGDEASGNPEKEYYLFLKCEGHPMSGLASTVKHLSSWLTKIRTGHGNVANPVLESLHESEGHLTGRAAENFPKHWKKLAKAMGLHGKRATFEQMLLGLANHLAMHHGDLAGEAPKETAEDFANLIDGEPYHAARLARYVSGTLRRARSCSTSSASSMSSTSSTGSDTSSVFEAANDAVLDDLVTIAAQHTLKPRKGRLYLEHHVSLDELRQFYWDLRRDLLDKIWITSV